MAITEGLQAIGINATPAKTAWRCTAGITGGTVNSYTDHRIAMAFAMAGLVATRPVTILDCANVNTSFPGFVELAQQAGLHIERQDSAGV
jgi:3-phosphoshikimate 1-carboxyvinyltransferase